MIEKETLKALVEFLDSHPDRLDVNEYTSHHFTDGLYVREMFLPAGTMLVGMEHKVENYFYVAAGRLTIWSPEGEVDVEAPWMGVVPAGAQRIGYAHEDTICFNTIPNPKNLTDIDEVEAEFFTPWTEHKTSFESAAITAAVVAVGSTVYSGIQAGKANKASRKGSKERRKADLMAQFIQRRKMLQDYRMGQAQVSAAAVASGAGLESSGVQGVQSSLTAQAYYNINTEEQILARENKAFGYDMAASRYSESSALWSTIGQVAGTFAAGLGAAEGASKAAQIAGKIGGIVGGVAPGPVGGGSARMGAASALGAPSLTGPSAIGDIIGGTGPSGINAIPGVNIKAYEKANTDGGAFNK